MSKIYVVGLGPGEYESMTPKAFNAMKASDIIIGYSAYIDLVKDYFPEKNLVSSGMRNEVERCELVLKLALEDKTVSIISSGDCGIYGMAGVMLEVLNNSGKKVPVEIIPGVTAASACAAALGAPVMHDFAVISLSDLLTPWETIIKRIEYAAAGDFVICIYNPRSKTRVDNIEIAREIMLRFKAPVTPVGIVKNAGREGQQVIVADLQNMLQNEIDMFTTVIVGNSKTFVADGRIITPRGYSV